MKSPMVMSRRRLIGGTAVGVVLATGSVVYVREAEGDRVSMLRDYLKSQQTLDELGAAYLSQYPHKANAETLIAAIFDKDTAVSDVSTKISQSDLKAFLADKVKSDYAAQKVIRLNGWVISQTEAQLSALVALGF